MPRQKAPAGWGIESDLAVPFSEFRQRSQRPPTLRAPVVFGRLPKLYRQKDAYLSGPRNPPDGFVVATTSASEWVMYWAVFKVLKIEGDPREEPFNGRQGFFSFQRDISGGREMRGGAVADFLVYGGRGMLKHATILRLQSEQWHYFTNVLKQASDEAQARMLGGVARMVDVDEIDLLGDPSGAKPCRTIADAIAGRYMPTPLGSSTQRRAGGMWRPQVPR